MSERILSSLLCALVGAMGAFLLGLVLAISSSEGDKSRGTVSMYIGGTGALLVCVALIIASLIGTAAKERPAARRLPERSRAPFRTDITWHAGQEGALRDQVLDVPSHEPDPGADAVESEAALVLLAEANLDTDRRADFEPPCPASAFRALGRRVIAASTGLPPEPGLTPLGTATESNCSPDQSLRRVEGANRKGRLCWICGKEHGPEIFHGTTAAQGYQQRLIELSGQPTTGDLPYDSIPEAWLSTAYDEALWNDASPE